MGFCYRTFFDKRIQNHNQPRSSQRPAVRVRSQLLLLLSSVLPLLLLCRLTASMMRVQKKMARKTRLVHQMMGLPNR